MDKQTKKELLIAAIILLVVVLIFVSPFFGHMSNIGGGLDWGEFYIYNGVPRESILNYHQFPFWNPFHCGGNFLFAHPQNDFFSPFFILVLGFGEVIGLKLKIIVALFVGMFGMYLLSRHLGMGKYSSFLPPMIFGLNSMFSTTLLVGQMWRLPILYLPWLLLFYLKSFENKKYILLCSLVLVFMIFEGVSYVFPFVILFLFIFAVLKSIFTKKLAPVKIFLVVAAIALIAGSIKIMPMFEVYGQFPRNIVPEKNDGIPFYVLSTTFLGKTHANADYTQSTRISEDLELYHEYSYYIGIIPILLFILGIVLLFKKHKELAIAAIIFFILMLGNNSPLNLWGLLRMLPVYKSQHLAERFVMIFGFCLAIFAGLFLSRLESTKIKMRNSETKKYSQIVVVILILFVLINLLYINQKPLQKTFTLEPAKEDKSQFYQLGNEFHFNWNFNSYKSFKENKGMVECDVEPMYPYVKNQTEFEKVHPVIPKYYVIEYDYIPSNGNHRPVFFYNNGELSIKWIIGDELMHLSEQKWYLNGNESLLNGVFVDANNEHQQVFPWQTNSKTIFFSDNVVMIDVLGQNIDLSYRRLNNSFTKKFESAGKAFAQNGKLVVGVDGGKNIFYLATDRYSSIEQNKQVDVNIIFYEKDNDITRIPNPEYKGEVFLVSGNGNSTISYFSPNKLIVEVDSNKDDVLAINQNYFDGWRYTIGKETKMAESLNGLISAKVPAGKNAIIFSYKPRSFGLGLIITLIILLLVLFLFYNKKTYKTIEKLLG